MVKLTEIEIFLYYFIQYNPILPSNAGQHLYVFIYFIILHVLSYNLLNLVKLYFS